MKATDEQNLNFKIFFENDFEFSGSVTLLVFIKHIFSKIFKTFDRSKLKFVIINGRPKWDIVGYGMQFVSKLVPKHAPRAKTLTKN